MSLWKKNYFLLCSLLLFTIIRLATSSELSEDEIEHYRHCANQLSVQLGDGTFSFSAIQIPPALPGVTIINSKLEIIQMHELTEEQVFSITVMFTLSWNDHRIKINDSECENSTAQFTVLTTRALMWYPQFTISNGHGNVLLKDAWQFNPAIIYTDGSVTWKIGANLFLECPMNVNLFPFDIQECSIDLTSPHYDVKTIKYLAESNAITAETGASVQSPVWRIIGQKTATVTDQYPSISFRFLIQRLSGFYTVAIVMPNVVVNIMMSYTFLLPAYQEEKTSTAAAGVTCYFFIQLLFYELSPISSDNIPGLIIFFSFHTILALIAYLVECRLIRFAEDLEEREKQKEAKDKSKNKLPEIGKKKEKQIIDFEDEEDAKKSGPFDGISADYLNDWCLIGYVVAVIISYIVVFVYLPVKAVSLRNNLIPSSYSTVEIESSSHHESHH